MSQNLPAHLEAIEQRLKAATPATEHGYLTELECDCRMAKISASNEDYEFNVWDEFTLEEADVELIANAPADLAFLLAALRESLAALEYVQLVHINRLERAIPGVEVSGWALEHNAAHARETLERIASLAEKRGSL